jgi:hypothetical protein
VKKNPYSWNKVIRELTGLPVPENDDEVLNDMANNGQYDDIPYLKWNDERHANRATGPVEMTIRSLVPSKWRFVDLETGDIWKWDTEKKAFTRSDLQGL